MNPKIIHLFFYSLIVIITFQSTGYSQYTENYAANFNGTNGYVSVRNSSDLNPTTGITVEAWVFPTALPTSMAVIGKNYLTSYYFGIESTGRFIFFPKGAGSFLRSKVSGTVKLNQWAHIAATYDGVITRLYLNGELDTSTNTITGAVGNNTDSLFIGADRFNGSPAFFFSGRLDNVRIWKSAKTQTEIARNRFIPLSLPAANGIYSSLSASYQFDNDVIDYSGPIVEYGNERNISYINYSDKAINYLDFNNSLVLNGTTDYARRGSYNSVYDPTVNLTMEAWIKRDTTGPQPSSQNIVNKSGGTTRYDYNLFILPTGQIIFAISNGSYNIQSAALVTNAQWTHVAAVYSQLTGKAVIYMNGDTVASGTFSGSPAIPSNNDSTFIGGIGATAYAANKFKGQIDEVRIWHKAARTQQQIKEYMFKHYETSSSDSLMQIDFDRSQNTFYLGNAPFYGSLRLVGNASFSSAHNIPDNRRSSPMLSDYTGEFHTKSYTTSTKRFFIPDANSAGISDSIFISGGQPVNNLKAFLLMTHTYTQDLRVTLTSPSGTTINLLINKGGSGNDVMTIFSDQADSFAASGFTSLNGPGISSAFSPSIKPDQSLSSFNGQSAAGWWKLKFIDLAGADIGYVHGWGINLLAKKTLNLTALIQGFYDPLTNKMRSDTAQMFFRIPLPPFPIIDSAKAVLDSNGNGKFYFNRVNNGYRVFKHRNSIETWTPVPIPFPGDTASYDFTTEASKAYGSNQIQVSSAPLRFAVYNGDVNQDGFVDLVDVTDIYNDANNFVTGYVKTDVTGNNITDLNDVILALNNSGNFVKMFKP